jgi:hypothetical protein
MESETIKYVELFLRLFPIALFVDITLILTNHF